MCFLSRGVGGFFSETARRENACAKSCTSAAGVLCTFDGLTEEFLVKLGKTHTISVFSPKLLTPRRACGKVHT